MSAFNFIGGIVFGTIVLSVLWLIVASALKGSDDKDSFGVGTTIVIIAFVVMLITAIIKCSSK